MSPQKLDTASKKTSSDSGAGSVIPGYSILARVGRGGMGAVFKAIQLSMHRLVALKILPISLAKDKTYIRRFLREAKSAAQMNHPNLTRVYDVGSYRGVFYFSMEFVEGTTLLGLINSENKLDVLTATDIALQAARGLQHAHSHLIVHRDIKPENIMIATDGSVKITDMGLAKRTDSADHDITVTGQVIGTPCYMSPEQITDPKSVDPRSDIYSLGATLYHMITGRRPYRGENSAQTMLKVVGEDPDWRRSDIPVSALRVIKKMMAKDPARRYQTAEELISELMYLKQKVLSPHRSRRMALISSISTSPLSAPPGVSIAIVNTPSRRLTLLLAVMTLAAVLAAIIFRRPPAEQSPLAQIQGSQAAVVRVEPGLSFEEYFKRGMDYGEENRWEEALANFTAATKIDPYSYDAWNNHGTCLWRLGRMSKQGSEIRKRRFEEAVDSYDKALDLNDEAIISYVNRGAALLELDRMREALGEFESAISLSPESYAAWQGKEMALRGLGLMREAREAMQKANQFKE